MSTSQILLAIGAGIGLLLGIAHGRMTLLDTLRPRYFTPVDDSVRIAMEGAKRIRMQGNMPLGPNANMWRVWLGFNLSHSLGVAVLSSIVLSIALWHFATFSESWRVQATVVAVTASYLAVSVRFWFIAPTIGVSVMLACFVGAVLLT